MSENIKQNEGKNPTLEFEITQIIPNTIKFKTFITSNENQRKQKRI